MRLRETQTDLLFGTGLAAASPWSHVVGDIRRSGCVSDTAEKADWPPCLQGGRRSSILKEGELDATYLVPSEFVTKMVDAGESKIFMSTRDTLIRAYMAGAILALRRRVRDHDQRADRAQPLLGAILFPVGFCMLYCSGFDL